MHGTNISEVELTNVSAHGIWIFVQNKEYFLPYTYFPWFNNAKINELSSIEMLKETHLYWPKLDVDLTFDMIHHPEKYPLASQK